MAERCALDDLSASARKTLSGWAGRAGAAPLESHALRVYQQRQPICGWRLELPVDGGIQILDLVVCEGFPWQPIKIAWVNRPAFLAVPHVERDGVLCLLSGAATIDIDHPDQVAAELLRDARELIEKLLAGGCVTDFRNELLTYWSLASDSKRKPIVSLCKVEGASRTIRIWRGATHSVVADDDATIARWLTNCGCKNAAAPATSESLLAVLPLAPLPRQYPKTGRMTADLLATSDSAARELFSEMMVKTLGDLTIIFAVATDHGRALIATELIVTEPPWPGRKPKDTINQGFRPGRVPNRLIVHRKLCAAMASRLNVDRADAGWIHGRGHDPRQSRLGQTKILLIGAGSLGAPIAQLLAQAGGGRLTIVDGEILSRANTSRHVLGADSVGLPKAEALAKKLRRDLPHIREVKAIFADVEIALTQHRKEFETADVIVCATGNWSANRAIADWRRASRSNQAVVYGWTEAHACAGHAVATVGPEDSFRRGFTATGVPLLAVTEWPEGSQLRQEPACGAVFQPYGPIELSYIAALVAETALDAAEGELLSPTHRIWSAPERQLDRIGGRWTREWLNLNRSCARGGRRLEIPWSHTEEVEANASEAAE